MEPDKEVLKAFFVELAEIAEARHRAEDAVPGPNSILWHYTTAEGLLGIVKSHELWATDMRHLSDYTEINHAETMIGEEIKRALEDCTQGDVVPLLKRIAHAQRRPDTSYAVCFCGTEDLLHQWISYGARGGGYAIGFDANSLARAVWVNPLLRLGRVTYKETNQRDRIRDAIRWVCETYRAMLDKYGALSPEHIIPWCSMRFRGQVLAYHFNFKNEVFEVEDEWRAVLLRQQYSSNVGQQIEIPDVQYRTVMGRIIPYVAISPSIRRGEMGAVLPITAIAHGPTVKAQSTDETISELLQHHGYTDVDVRKSKIPLR